MKRLGLCSLVLGSLIGCDESREILLNEIKIEGQTRVELYQEIVKIDIDHYKIKIYDSKNKLRANFVFDRLSSGTRMIDEDGKTYVVKDEKRYYIKDKISEN